MKFLRKILPVATTLAVAGGLFFGFGGGVAKAAACQFQYSATNFQTSTTPVFNSICGVPTLFNSTNGQYAFGDETDFVRIRPDTSNDVTSNKNNPPLVGGTLNSACTAGSKYDILTYIHNDASQDFNNNGTGSAVAHNVKLAIGANGIGTTNDQFTFTSAITADAPAVGATDSAMLDCNGQQVQLNLVSGSVHYNTSFDTSTSWTGIGDSAVNGTTMIGSPTWGSGTQWGCWNYLTAVVYQVTVTPVQPQPASLECTFIKVDQDTTNNRRVTVTIQQPNVQNASVSGFTIGWGDTTSASNKQSDTHTYASNITQATISGSVTGTVNGSTVTTTPSGDCIKTVSFTSTPPATPPTSLPKTGAGSVAGLFAGVTAAGAAGYRWLLGRKLARQ